MANVGDLFVNFKVNTDGLNAGSGALSSFVSKSKRDIGAMNGGVDALSQSLSKLGLDPSFVLQFRDFVQLGTKQLPKMVEGLTAFARQAAAISAANVAMTATSVKDLIGPMPLPEFQSIGPMPLPEFQFVGPVPLPEFEFVGPVPLPEFEFIGPLPLPEFEFIGPMPAPILPDIELAPLEAARSSILNTRSEIERLADAGKTRFPRGGVLSYGNEIEEAMRRARESAASGSAAVADAIELSSAGVIASTKKVEASVTTLAPAATSGTAAMADALQAGSASVAASTKKIEASVSSVGVAASQIETSVASSGVATTQAFTKSASSATTFGSKISAAATRAVSAARAIGAAIYATIGPIGLAVAAIAAIGIAFYKVASDQAAAAEEAFERTLTMVKDRADAAAKALAEMGQMLAKSREGLESMGGKVRVQEAVLAAPAGQEEAAAKQAERLNQQLAASNAIIAAEQQRDELQRKASAASADLVRTQQAYDDALADGNDEIAERTRQILEAKQQETKALEDAANKARLNVDATSDQLLLLQQSLDLEDKIAAKKAEQESIERARLDREAGITAFMAEELSLEDERLRLMEGEEALQTALYQRRLEAAGIEEQMIAYLMAQRAEVEALSKTREEADRKEQERKSTLEAIAGDLAKREADIEATNLELTIGKAEAEAKLLEMKMRSLGVGEKEIRATMERLAVIQDQEKAIKGAQKAEEERQKMVERAAQLEKDIAAATESARTKAMEDDLKRQQITETLSTAIGGITVAGASDAIDIDKRVYDETKKQTDELKKINEALRSGGVAVLT